jgi:hypothetical protein
VKFSPIILNALDVDDSPEGIEYAGDLLRESNYIYPVVVSTLSVLQVFILFSTYATLQNGNFDYNRPFCHAVITFFSSTKYSKNVIGPNKSQIFYSSIPEKPLELELPKSMLALAGCVVRTQLAFVIVVSQFLFRYMPFFKITYTLLRKISLLRALMGIGKLLLRF